MKLKFRKTSLALMMIVAITLSGAVSLLRADTGTCGGANVTLPFTDVVGNGFFCAIAAAYFSGLTNGTTATTYSPNDAVPRAQMAAFITRTLDQSLKRGSKRAALNQFWTTTPQYAVTVGGSKLGTTGVGSGSGLVASDGVDLWVASASNAIVGRVRASDGKYLESWGAPGASNVLVAMGRVFATGLSGELYMIDPSKTPAPATLVANNLGGFTVGIAFDGARIWTVSGSSNSVSIITPGSPFTVTTIGGFNQPRGILFDGANMWVTNEGNGTLVKLNANGGIMKTVQVGNQPRFPIYDGTNIWVPCHGSSVVTVVRAVDGAVLATLSDNGLGQPSAAAFDGERILVTNMLSDSVSLWKAADLTPLGSFATGAGSDPYGVCSDGVNFWITLYGADKLARF